MSNLNLMLSFMLIFPGGFHSLLYLMANICFWIGFLPLILHINYKEVLAIVLAAKQWGSKWCNQHVIIYSDSTTAVGIINKDTCRNPIVMHYLRELFWLSAIYNFQIIKPHIFQGLKIPLQMPFHVCMSLSSYSKLISILHI